MDPFVIALIEPETVIIIWPFQVLADEVRLSPYVFYCRIWLKRGLGDGFYTCWDLMLDHGKIFLFQVRQFEGSRLCLGLPSILCTPMAALGVETL